MSSPFVIQKLGEVKEVQLLVEAGSHNAFQGSQLFIGVLPYTFFYGNYRTLHHTCLHCKRQVVVEFVYGKQILAGGDLSRQGFHENKILLDAVGVLFDLTLHHAIDENGFESYIYLTDASNATGALLDVAYYRCAHCQTQYLVTYQVHIADQRPPFEPDTIYIGKILQVSFDHSAFLNALNPFYRESRVA